MQEKKYQPYVWMEEAGDEILLHEPYMWMEKDGVIKPLQSCATKNPVEGKILLKKLMGLAESFTYVNSVKFGQLDIKSQTDIAT